MLTYALSYRVQVAGIFTLAPAGQASQLSWLGEVNAIQVCTTIAFNSAARTWPPRKRCSRRQYSST